MSAYRRGFDKTKYMSFFNKLFKKHIAIWKKISNIIEENKKMTVNL